MKIQVKKFSEDRGFCREYYKCVDSGLVVARQEDWPGVFNW